MFRQIKDFDPKDPVDQCTYSLDFTADLMADGSETIVNQFSVVTNQMSPSIVIDPPGDLVVQSVTVIDNAVYAYITGGVAGTTYALSYEIVTSAQTVLRRSVNLPCELR